MVELWNENRTSSVPSLALKSPPISTILCAGMSLMASDRYFVEVDHVLIDGTVCWDVTAYDSGGWISSE